jgi:cyclopropane fatty-acyl-phospholipid synthase-like methyltransferase
VNDGRTLTAIAPATVDGVWSFDVFVHLAPPDIDSYLAEIFGVLRHGSRAVVHHAKHGRGEYLALRRMRSRMTATMFAEMLQRHSLTLITQFDAWGVDGQFSVRPAGDVISVFQK